MSRSFPRSLRSVLPTRQSMGVLTVAALALSLAACGAGGTESTGGSTAGAAGSGDKLNVLVEGGGLAELQPIADAFTKETGTEVTFVELPYAGLFDRLSADFQSGKPSADVVALDAVWLTTFAGGVEPLDDLYTDTVKKDLFPALVEEAQVKGAFVGMPVWTNAEVVFYRTDLWNDPKEKADFEAAYGYPLAPPTTWQQYTDMAKFFTRDTDGDGETDLYGTDVKGAVETEWLAHVLQAGAPGTALGPDGDVIVNDAAHKAALDFYVSLLPYSPPGAPQIDWGAAQNLFNQGNVAMTRFWAHAYRQIPADSSVAGKVGVAPMIAGKAGVGAVPGPWYLSVPSGGDQTEKAKKFVAFAYENNALSVETDLGLAARVSAYEKFADKKGFESFTPLIDTLSGEATTPRPATPHWQQIVDTVLIPTVQAATESGADTQAILDKAAADIEKIVG